MSKPPKPPTRAELARSLGISTRRLYQLKGEGMPTDCTQSAVAWRQANSGTSGSVELLRLERIKLVREQRQSKELENAARRRELVPIGEVIADISKATGAARGELLKLSADLPPRLDGLSPAKMQVVIREAVIAILERLSDETSELYK